MSPLLRDELRVVLYPDQVLATRIARTITQRGIRRHVVARRRLPCDAGGDMPWAAAVSQLGDTMPPLCGGKVFGTVIVSNHFMRYTIVPWTDSLSGPAEEEAYARHCFRQYYGFASDTWDLRMSARQAGMPRLGSAVDSRLIGALRGVFAQARTPLKSIQPHLMAAFNLCRRSLRERCAWFVLHEPGSLCLALMRDACWSSVRTIKVGGDWIERLPVLLEREAYLAELETDAETVWLWAPALGASAPSLGTDGRVRNLIAAMPADFISDYVPDFPMAACP